MDTNLAYNYMTSIEGSPVNPCPGDNNDLNKFFDMPQYSASPSKGMYAYESGFLTPNGMNINNGLGGALAQNIFPPTPGCGQLQYQLPSSDFPFPQQPVDPAAIMNPDRAQGSESSQGSSQEQSQEPKVYVPKLKRTRRSKKKPLSEEEAEKKREEFLERNRVAASKCRKRKQEHTQDLQENHVRLQHDKFYLQESIKDLQNEVARLRAMLVGHHGSGGCQKPQILVQQIAQIESMNNNGPIYGSPDVAPTAYDNPMSRSSSAMSYVSISRPGYKPDGTPDLMSPHCPESELKRLNQERLAKDEEYMKTYKMSRQNSNESNSSRTSGSEGTGKESGYMSDITSPDREKLKEQSPLQPASTTTGLRRGCPRKSLQVPPSPEQGFVDQGFMAENLQGVQHSMNLITQYL